ncbi:MAG: hypothetical protein A3D65_05275 [Candidatus Lloydbacteria bacterium RIFCSPHIGHO2_02_FULL_50_13]|uniref:Uncharacterized protein n=1 Tax=Candidatus Lloydbacteria bacterium RIFCSPHIGHO2_02_FULL_50_13 TaxID=1798661 RepID=A0A1G2D9Y1_9BACT|nr:MAG: hypothetical protein A3D65_05275 [Candidatus Lloydbacteria bacterium RIFCSPHIGHO2_02_FULL_50_13]
MKADLKKVVRSPWFWVPVAILLWCTLFLGSVSYFDLFDEQWEASLTNEERSQLEETWKGIVKIGREGGAPWPTFVEFKDGRVGLVYTDLNPNERATLLVNGKPSAILRSHRGMFEFARIIYPGDPSHEDAKQKFFQ